MRKDKGFTLIELMLVIVIIAILAAVALPNFMGATEKARESAVTSAVKAIQTSLEMYAVDHNGTYPSTATGNNALDAISGYLPNGKFPNNPSNNTPYSYTNGLADITSATASPTVSIPYSIIYCCPDGIAYDIIGLNRANDTTKPVIKLSNH